MHAAFKLHESCYNHVLDQLALAIVQFMVDLL